MLRSRWYKGLLSSSLSAATQQMIACYKMVFFLFVQFWPVMTSHENQRHTRDIPTDTTSLYLHIMWKGRQKYIWWSGFVCLINKQGILLHREWTTCCFFNIDFTFAVIIVHVLCLSITKSHASVSATPYLFWKQIVGLSITFSSQLVLILFKNMLVSLLNLNITVSLSLTCSLTWVIKCKFSLQCYEV